MGLFRTVGFKVLLGLVLVWALGWPWGAVAESPGQTTERILLPPPRTSGPMSLEETLFKRRSVRNFAHRKLSMKEISQLLWAAQGVTDRMWGRRTSPSAGGLYPLEIYVVTPEAVYRYLPGEHALVKVKDGDVRGKLCAAGLGQPYIREALLDLVIAGVYERTRSKYGARAERYVWLEAGHAAQNVLLQAVALGLGGVPIGAFRDQAVQQAIGCPRDHQPLYIIPIGYPK